MRSLQTKDRDERGAGKGQGAEQPLRGARSTWAEGTWPGGTSGGGKGRKGKAWLWEPLKKIYLHGAQK